MVTLPRATMPFLIAALRGAATFKSAAGAEARIAERALRPLAWGPPKGLETSARILPVRQAGWPGYELLPLEGEATGGTVVFVHGGGWVNEIAGPHWRLAARIAAEKRARVLLPIYPLVPFGTAREVVAGVVALAAAAAAAGEDVALVGDSAGGQIALSAALVLRDEHRLVLRRTVLVSPAVDLAFENPEIDAVEPTDPLLGRPGGRVLAQRWRGELPVDDPRVSPIRGEVAGLGPIAIFIGTRDCLYPDVRLFAERARAAEVDVELNVSEGSIHVYPLLPTREARDAQSRILELLSLA